VMMGYDHLPGATITRYCSSSLQTTRMAFHAIKAGEGDAFISAGVECVSRYANGSSDSWPDTHNPVFAAAEERTTARSGEGTPGWHDPREGGGVPDVYIAMGQTAENVAQLRGITRRAQDEFGVRSQNLAEKALANGFWQRDITPLTLPDARLVAADDGPRAGTTLEKVAALQPVFRPDGTVTAGNCCPLNDGAAAVVVMSDRKAAELGIAPLARIVSTGVSALSPEIMGLGPVEASKQALAIDIDKLNVNGGAIAVGHPFGMTGARITSTLLNSLQFHDKTFGLETMCVGGGQGMAMVVERLS
jgi:acetyl-CoA C-acetyltransferase